MKVIVAGFIKTGSKSMAAALTKLGYRVYDFEQNFEYLGDEWLKIFRNGGTKEDFRRMYENVDAGTDAPFTLFWEEIADAFPDAKIIFTQRSSEEAWMKSVEGQVVMCNENLGFRLLSVFSYTGNKLFRFCAIQNRIMFGGHNYLAWNAFKGLNPTISKKRYRDHCTAVLTRAPKDRLLVFNLEDGWGPLCEFLGKDIPDAPFPHENVKGEIIAHWMMANPLFDRMKNEMMISFGMLGIVSCFIAYRFLKPMIKF